MANTDQFQQGSSVEPRSLTTILVSYWRSGGFEKTLKPGDITIALDRFPVTDLEVETIRDVIQGEISKNGLGKCDVVITNIVRLGE